MAKDIMNFEDASAIDFGDEPLSFDSNTTDNSMHDMSSNRFTPINNLNRSQTSLPETVSPADLLYGEFSSIPGSNSFTNLTTPSMLDDNSPFLTDSTNVSPAFESVEFGLGRFEDGSVPLFPSNDFDHMTSGMQDKANDDIDLNASFGVGLTNINTTAMSRSTSARSIPDTPNSGCPSKAEMLRHRLSVNAGISKASRRATKNLGPIEVDESDDKAVKRAKNTMAARKSRQKKKDELDVLESKLLEMMEERDYWKMTAVSYGAPVPDGH